MTSLHTTGSSTPYILLVGWSHFSTMLALILLEIEYSYERRTFRAQYLSVKGLGPIKVAFSDSKRVNNDFSFETRANAKYARSTCIYFDFLHLHLFCICTRETMTDWNQNRCVYTFDAKKYIHFYRLQINLHWQAKQFYYFSKLQINIINNEMNNMRKINFTKIYIPEEKRKKEREIHIFTIISMKRQKNEEKTNTLSLGSRKDNLFTTFT